MLALSKRSPSAHTVGYLHTAQQLTNGADYLLASLSVRLFYFYSFLFRRKFSDVDQSSALSAVLKVISGALWKIPHLFWYTCMPSGAKI